MSDTTTIIRIGHVKQAAMDAEERIHRARQTVRTYQGNCSITADRLVAEQYESLRRSLPSLHNHLPVVAWFFLEGKPPVTGAPASGTTSQIDPQGLVLNVRLPEPAWVTALLTGKMLVRMGITLAQGRGRMVATGQVGWMEAHRPQDPMRLGIYFTEIAGFDRDRIIRLIREDKEPTSVAKTMTQKA